MTETPKIYITAVFRNPRCFCKYGNFGHEIHSWCNFAVSCFCKISFAYVGRLWYITIL